MRSRSLPCYSSFSWYLVHCDNVQPLEVGLFSTPSIGRPLSRGRVLHPFWLELRSWHRGNLGSACWLTDRTTEWAFREVLQQVPIRLPPLPTFHSFPPSLPPLPSISPMSHSLIASCLTCLHSLETPGVSNIVIPGMEPRREEGTFGILPVSLPPQ